MFVPNFKKVAQREWQRITRRKTLWVLLFVMPVLLFLSLAPIYQKGAVRHLPLGVWDQDQSALSRLIVRSLAATSTFEVYGYYTSLKAIKQDFKRGHLQAALVIPNGLEKAIKTGKPAHVVFYKNSANLIIGNLSLKAAFSTLQTLSTGIEMKKFQAAGQSAPQALESAWPIVLETHALYNPYYNYENYLIGGLLPILLQMVILISAVMVFSTERHENTLNDLWQTAEGHLWAVVFGKSLPHLLLHFANVLLLLGLVFPVFHIPIHASIFKLLLFFFLFTSAVLFVGLFLSCLFKNQVLATEAAIFISTPAFIFTGYTFPLEAMPAFHNFYAHLLPSTYFMTGYLKIWQMNAPLEAWWPELFYLLVFFTIGFWGTVFFLRQQFRPHFEAVEVKA